MEARSKQFDPRAVRAAGSRKGGESWHRLLPWLYGLVALLVIALIGAILWPQFETSMAYQKRKAELQGELAAQEVQSRILEEDLMALQHDPVYVERMARDILSVGRQGETIFRFQPYSDNRPTIIPGTTRP
jgi:cell division protein FtsB